MGESRKAPEDVVPGMLDELRMGYRRPRANCRPAYCPGMAGDGVSMLPLWVVGTVFAAAPAAILLAGVQL